MLRQSCNRICSKSIVFRSTPIVARATRGASLYATNTGRIHKNGLYMRMSAAVQTDINRAFATISPTRASQSPEPNLTNPFAKSINPSIPPEVMLGIFRGRVDMCTPDNEDRLLEVALRGEDPPSIKYYRLILCNIRLLHAYLASVNLEEFMFSSDGPLDPPIKQGREGLITVTRAFNRWLSRAVAEADFVEPEMKDAHEMFAMTDQAIEAYTHSQEVREKHIPWTMLCDVCIQASLFIEPHLENAIGGLGDDDVFQL